MSYIPRNLSILTVANTATNTTAAPRQIEGTTMKQHTDQPRRSPLRAIVALGDAVHARLASMRWRGHLVFLVAAFATLGVVNAILNSLYAASNHPVSYAEGQTSFDAASVEGWYATMSDAGTLDVYVGTQIFDYVFMLALAAFALTAASVLRRSHARRPRLAAVARIGGLGVVIGTLFDAAENIVSFVMLGSFAATDPSGFADWLVLPYSAAAVAKFASIAIGFVALAVALAGAVVLTVAGRSTGRRSSGSTA